MHSAVAVFKRFRRLVKAKPGKQKLLERVQHVEVYGGEDESEEESSSQITKDKLLYYYVKLLSELRAAKLVKLYGTTVRIEIPIIVKRGKEVSIAGFQRMHIPRQYFPQEALEA